MIVAGRREFHQNLTDHADTGLLDIQYRNRIEITDDLHTHLAELRNADMLRGDKFLYLRKPFFVQGIHGTRSCFIRTHPVDTTHEDVTKFCTHSGT